MLESWAYITPETYKLLFIDFAGGDTENVDIEGIIEHILKDHEGVNL